MCCKLATQATIFIVVAEYVFRPYTVFFFRQLRKYGRRNSYRFRFDIGRWKFFIHWRILSSFQCSIFVRKRKRYRKFLADFERSRNEGGTFGKVSPECEEHIRQLEARGEDRLEKFVLKTTWSRKSMSEF